MVNSDSCFYNKKSKVVRIVYPGGHIELHDNPILAGEIMAKHPKFVVAQPEVFRLPLSAVVSPETTLMLGQKFYAVPASTIRKLQRKYIKRNPLSSAEGHYRNYAYDNSSSNRRVGCLSNMITMMTGFGHHRNRDINDDYRMVRIVYNGDRSSGGSSGSFGSPVGKRSPASSPKKGMHMDYYWTPNLESITE